MKFSLLNLSVASYTADHFLPLQILYFCEFGNTVNTLLTATLLEISSQCLAHPSLLISLMLVSLKVPYLSIYVLPRGEHHSTNINTYNPTFTSLTCSFTHTPDPVFLSC